MDVPSYLLGKQAGGGGGQPSLQNKSVTITENGTQNVTADTGYDGLNNVEVITNVSGGGGLDWSAIGYSGMPQIIQDGYDYAENIYNNWDSTQTSLNAKFDNDLNLVYMPLVDTSNATRANYMFRECNNLQICPALNLSACDDVNSMFLNCASLREVGLLDIKNATNMQSMFGSCTLLKEIPLLNTSKSTNTNSMFSNCRNLLSVPQLDIGKVTNASSMFYGCYKLQTVPELNPTSVTNMSSMFNNCRALTDTSLDNILKTCINATSYTGTKTLVQIGITQYYYSASRIQALPHYQDFLDAGWTTGY